MKKRADMGGVWALGVYPHAPLWWSAPGYFFFTSLLTNASLLFSILSNNFSFYQIIIITFYFSLNFLIKR